MTFLFATGRTEVAARNTLAELPFPYYLAPQNGTALIAFPSETRVKTHPLDLSEISKELLKKWVLVGLNECFYSKDYFSGEKETYLLSRASRLKETYVSKPPRGEIFALKKFGLRQDLEQEIIPFKESGFSVILTRDVINSELAVAQVMPKGINKGSALDDLIQFLPKKPSFLIGFGDDVNDLPLLEKTDLKVVMEDAPDAVKERADLIAPRASEKGFFTALEKIFIL